MFDIDGTLVDSAGLR